MEVELTARLNLNFTPDASAALADDALADGVED
jgi:hypothetical protein